MSDITGYWTDDEYRKYLAIQEALKDELEKAERKFNKRQERAYEEAEQRVNMLNLQRRRRIVNEAKASEAPPVPEVKYINYFSQVRMA